MNFMAVAIKFSYCSWPPIQQKSRLLIGLNCILLCLNDSSQIAKKGQTKSLQNSLYRMHDNFEEIQILKCKQTLRKS